MCDPIVLGTKYEFIKILYLFFDKKEKKKKNVLCMYVLNDEPFCKVRKYHIL